MIDPFTLTGQPGVPNLAVDVQPDSITGTFSVDVSEVDGPDLLGWSAEDAGTWVNIVCDVIRVGYRRGAAQLHGLLTGTEAGTGSLTLSDTLRAFDPTANADVIHKGSPLRVRAWGYTAEGERWDAVLFTAEVDEVAVAYQKADAPLVTVTMADLVAVLAAWGSEGRPDGGVGAGDNLLQRVQRVLAEVGRGTVSPDSDSGYSATLAPTLLARPWSELIDATEAELGRLWMDAANQVVVRARGAELSGPVRGTLSDVHGEAPLGVHCCVADAHVVYGPEQLTNRAIAARKREQADGGMRYRRDDPYSQDRYGVRMVERSSLLVETDEQADAWTEELLQGSTMPTVRVDSVTPAPSATDLDSALSAWPAVLQTDLGDRWLFRFHPTHGPVVDLAVGVVGIELDVTPDEWTVRWVTAPAPAPGESNPSGWFLLDVSELYGPDLLLTAGASVVTEQPATGVSVIDGGTP